MSNDVLQNRISFYQNVAETKDSIMKRFAFYSDKNKKKNMLLICSLFS